MYASARGRRWLWAAPAVAIVCLALVAGAGAALATQGRPLHHTTTAVLHVTPLTAGGALRSGYKVTHRFPDATCQKGSAETGTAYRCTTPRSSVELYDPCWVKHSTSYVVCVEKPWSRHVVQLRVDSYDDSGSFPKVARPWGAQPSLHHVRCLLQPASVVEIRGHDVWYRCNRRTVLAGTFRRGDGLWSARAYRSVQDHPDHYRSLGWQSLPRVWRGARSGTPVTAG